MRDQADDSLLLSYSSRSAEPKGTERAALSPSQASRFAEDPHLFYLKKVRGLDEPMSMPLVVGIAAHDAMEEFLTSRYQRELGWKESVRRASRECEQSLEGVWDELDEEDRVVKENPDDASNPRDREERSISLSEQTEELINILHGQWRAIEQYGGQYSAYAAQHNPQHVEVPVGKLADQNGQPTSTIYSYDPVQGRMRDMRVGLLGSVPIRGRIDCVGRKNGWDRPMIIDHKCSSKVVPYYPKHGRPNADWTRYDPSYNAADDLQLDLYSGAGGVERAGFQFMLRRPQHLPDDNVLYPGWVDERVWEDEGLPMSMVTDDEGRVRYVTVWRPTVEDGAAEGHAYNLQSVRYRAATRIRDIAERMTESFLLLQDGVKPTVAFPGGDPDEIARKACPFCHFGPEGTRACGAPREPSKKSKADYEEALEERESHCEQNSRVQERREHWDHVRQQLDLPPRPEGPWLRT